MLKQTMLLLKKEFLAVVFAGDKFRPYIVDSKVTIHTDHAAIKYLMEKKMLNLDLLDGFSCYKNLMFLLLSHLIRIYPLKLCVMLVIML